MRDLYMLFFRSIIGLSMLWGHGWGKLINYSTLAGNFPDPLGIGSELSLLMLIGAEVFASILLILGFFVRLSILPLIIAMGTAFFVFHSADPWDKKELAFTYLIPFIYIFFTGAGKYSLASWLKTYLPLRDNKIIKWLTD